MLQNLGREERFRAREKLRTEALEGFSGLCSGYMRRLSWPVIAQADVRSGGGGAGKWLRFRHCASERSNSPLCTRRDWASGHFAARFS